MAEAREPGRRRVSWLSILRRVALWTVAAIVGLIVLSPFLGLAIKVFVLPYVPDHWLDARVLTSVSPSRMGTFYVVNVGFQDRGFEAYALPSGAKRPTRVFRQSNIGSPCFGGIFWSADGSVAAFRLNRSRVGVYAQAYDFRDGRSVTELAYCAFYSASIRDEANTALDNTLAANHLVIERLMKERGGAVPDPAAAGPSDIGRQKTLTPHQYKWYTEQPEAR